MDLDEMVRLVKLASVTLEGVQDQLHALESGLASRRDAQALRDGLDATNKSTAQNVAAMLARELVPGAAPVTAQRPTSDAPEVPGKRRRTCGACNTKQYSIKDGRCAACRELDAVTLSAAIGT